MMIRATGSAPGQRLERFLDDQKAFDVCCGAWEVSKKARCRHRTNGRTSAWQ